MAERRMFAKTIIDSDAFLDMPLSSQSLYFHLSMRADDDGFINNPKKIQKMIGASDDDLKLLIAKSFLIPFESGIVVIKHWKIHNYIRNDRYKETTYVEEKGMLSIKENKAYTLNGSAVGIPNGYQMDTQVRLGKDRLGKDRLGKECISDAEASTRTPKHNHGEYNHVKLTDKEYQTLVTEYGVQNTTEYIKFLDEYIEMKGYKAKSHYLCIKKWVIDAVKERERKKAPQNKVAQELDDFYKMAEDWAKERTDDNYGNQGTDV